MGLGRALMCRWVFGAGMACAAAATLLACGDPSGASAREATSAGTADTVDVATAMSPFCAQALGVLDKASFPTDGGTVVADLRRIEASGLSNADRDAFVAGIDELERELDGFNNGQSVDGWSTSPIATVVSRACRVSDVITWHVMP